MLTIPDDVLYEIFYTIAARDPPPGSVSSPHTNAISMYPTGLGWIRLTHVCQRWRTILLGLSALWGKVAFTFHSIQAFATLLERAQSAPVDITVIRGFQPSYWTIAALRHLSRARELTMTSPSYNQLITFCRKSEPMPQLRHLYLNLQYTNGDAIMGVLPDSQVLHIDAAGLESAFFDFGTATTTRRNPPGISSPRTIFSAWHFNTPSLRHIDITIADVAGIFNDFEWISRLLHASPLVKTLSFSLDLHHHTPNWGRLLQTLLLQLSHLQRVFLKNTSEQHLHRFLKWIRPLPPAFLSASYGQVIGNDDSNGPQGPAWAVNFAHNYGGYLCRSGHGALAITTERESGSLSIQSMPTLADPAEFADEWLRFRTASSVSDPSLEPSKLAEGVVLNIATRPRAEPASYQWVAVLAERIPDKDSVEQLFLRIRVNHDVAWEELLHEHLLRPLVNLHTLYLLQPEPLHHFTGPIWKDAASRMLSNTNPPLLPRLHTLLVNMEVHRHPHSVHSLRDRLGQWLDDLTSVLSRRRTLGVPVQMLRILGCWPSEGVKEFMQPVTDRKLARISALVDVVIDERIIL